MKNFFPCVCILVVLLIFPCKYSKGQTIVIEDTVELKKNGVKRFQNEEAEIKQSDLKKQDIRIDIDASFKVTKLFKIIEGSEMPQPQPDGLKKAPNQLAGFVSFILAKDPNYDQEEITLMIELPKKDTLSFRIITKKDEGNIKEEGTKLPACKIEQLQKINYTFIHDTLMRSFAINECGGILCKNCEPANNIIQYDFKNNETIKKFPRSFKGSDDIKSKHPNVGGPVEFIVRNVNPYLYDITISDTTLNYNTEDTGGFLGLLQGGDIINKAITPAGTGADNNEKCPLNDTDKVRKAIEDLYEQLGKFYGELLLTSPYTDASCFGDIIAKVKRSINDTLSKYFRTSLHINNYNTLVGFMKAKRNIFTDQVIGALDSAYQKIETRHLVYAYKVPEVDNVDEIQFRFNVTPKNKDLALPVVSKGLIRVYNKGGFKIDVSSGLYYGFFNNENAKLRKDSIETNPGVFKKGNRIYREDLGKGEFGFASFLHFYPRTGGFLNVSGTIGAGLNLSDNPKPRYFGGISILAGRGTNRIGLNLGVIMGNTTRLSDQYLKDASGNYVMLPEDEKELITKEKFNSNFFVSLSYNLPFVLKKTKMPQTSTAPPIPAVDDKEAKKDTAKKDEPTNTESQSSSGTKSKLSEAKTQQSVIIQNLNSDAILKEKTTKKYYKKNK